MIAHSTSENTIITVGQLGKVYGLQGWITVNSFTEPADNLFQYKPLYIKLKSTDWQPCEFTDYKPHTHRWIARVNDYCNCGQARDYVNAFIGVNKADLPACDEDEFYWHELIGLTVINHDKTALGQVTDIFTTGANPILTITHHTTGQAILIPYLTNQVIINVDLTHQTLYVNWDLDA